MRTGLKEELGEPCALKNNCLLDARARALFSPRRLFKQIQQRLNCHQRNIQEVSSDQYAQAKQALKNVSKRAVSVGNCNRIHLQGMVHWVHCKDEYRALTKK